MASELTGLTARAMVDRLRAGDVTPAEALDAAEARIAATDGTVNALPTRCFERARDRLSGLTRTGDAAAWLAGLPIAIKDLTTVAGVRTTWGSRIHENHVPATSDILVERLEANGGLVVAKSNTPEFGAGGNTFNDVFGATLNPWRTDLTAGGSSGGAAAALASGQVWLAHGSDLGGSLRTPAAYCGVVGLRPSPGRVAHGAAGAPRFDLLSVDGPMGRNAGDVALMLDAMAGHDSRDPLSIPSMPGAFQAAIDTARPPRRIAFTADFGGALAVEPALADAARSTVTAAFGALGTEIVDMSPDIAGAMDAFHVFRALGFVAGRGEMIAANRALVKPEVWWNYELGLTMTADDLARAERTRARLFHSLTTLFEHCDLLVTPATGALPFPVIERYPEQIDGTAYDNYVDWMSMTSVMTLTGCPVVALPCAILPDGRPAGIQIVGRPRCEADVLAAAHLLEPAFGIAARMPIDPISAP